MKAFRDMLAGDDANIVRCLSRSFRFDIISRLNFLDSWSIFVEGVVAFYFMSVACLAPAILRSRGGNKYDIIYLAGKNLLVYYSRSFLLALFSMFIVKDVTLLKLWNIATFSFVHIQNFSTLFANLPQNPKINDIYSLIQLVVGFGDLTLFTRNIRNIK